MVLPFLVTISGIPPAERLMKKLPGFAEYRERTSAFIPWFPKDGAGAN